MPRHVHAQAVPRTNGERLMCVATIVLILGIP